VIAIVGVPACKNGQVEHIDTNLCCYISLRSQHSTDFKSSSNFFVWGGGSRLKAVDIQGLAFKYMQLLE